MITLTHIPLFFSQTCQSIEQYYKLLKGTQMLSGAAQKNCLLICHIGFFMALVQPIQSQHSTDFKSGLFHFIKGIMKLELNRELSLGVNRSKVVLSGDFKYNDFKWKKNKWSTHESIKDPNLCKTPINSPYSCTEMSPWKFEWHLNFLFLALETNLRKSPSCWWRCFVLCYSCKCSNSSWNSCSPLCSPCSWDEHVAIYVLTGHFSDSLQHSEIFFSFYLCFCLHHCR